MNPAHVWEGVYASFAEVPAAGDGFTGETWIERSRRKFLEAREHMERTGTVPESLQPALGLLPHALRSVGRSEVTVLDYGGGLGLTYRVARKALQDAPRLRFTVVELANVCAEGRRLHAPEDAISFVTPDSHLPGPFDVVHLGSSLQYIEDWKALLSRLAPLASSQFVITDLPAGDNPSYVTAQTYYGAKIPCWFFRRDEVVEHVRRLGLHLVEESPYLGTVLGERGLPQSNFPPELRVGRARNLRFQRASS